jgi:hypothetical protein
MIIFCRYGSGGRVLINANENHFYLSNWCGAAVAKANTLLSTDIVRPTA